MKEQFVSEIQGNSGLIIKICRMYCDTKEDQEDLFQDIVVQLWRSYSSFKGLSRFSTWLYRIALNTAVTRLKTRKRQATAAELNHDDKRCSLPVIILSAYPRVIDSLGYYNCNAFIPKPFDLDDLVNNINRLIAEIINCKLIFNSGILKLTPTSIIHTIR